MTAKNKLKDSFEVESKHGAFYTGGSVEWHDDKLYCQTKSNISILNLDDGVVTTRLGDEDNTEDAETVHTFTVHENRLVSAHKSGLLKLWDTQSGEILKIWKSIHKAPIAKLAFNASNPQQLASGGADSIVRIWDLQFHSCTLSLKGCQGVVNVVAFHPTENVLFASGDDGKLNCYELTKGALSLTYSAHYSKITSLVFTHDPNKFVTSARDKVIILWEFNNATPLKIIPVYEAIESIVALPIKFSLPQFKADPANVYVASGGEQGILRVWDVTNAKAIYVQTNSLISKAQEEGGLSITNLLYNEKQIAIVSAEHNIVVHNLKSLVCTKQFIGFTDEILDIVFVGHEDSHIAVATNSSDIKLYNNATNSCQLLKGHTDFVLSLSTSRTDPTRMMSSSKDNSVRLWQLDGEIMTCIATGRRHTASVGSVAFSQTDATFAVSASQDNCLKIWDLNAITDGKLGCTNTVVAHEKDVNCTAIAPNDKLIATSSQDKTAKLWTMDLELAGVLRGHKRGVWCIRFSPVDQVVVTSSADCTIKLWSVLELNCLKTFEGHESSVLRIEFVANGLQLLSAGADGLLKLYSLKTSECVSTLDEHAGRIWALAIRRDESGLVTGGSDSCLLKWRDVSEEHKLEKQKEADELALQEQKLHNYMQSENLLKALKLALRLDRPMQVLKIVQGTIRKGMAGLDETVKALRNDQKESLLKCALSWNMNSRHCHAAQLVLNILIGELQAGEFRPAMLNSSVEGALPYTERHFKRLTQTLQDLQLLNYTVNCMRPHAKVL